MTDITAEEARALLRYEPSTGLFFWRVNVSRGRKGKAAGCIRRDGRRVLRLRGKLYLAYRLAYLMQTGEWPPHEIDHIDGNPGNDAWRNLRPATRGQNARNIPARRDNKTGLKGVSPHPCGKYQAQLRHDGRTISLGLFLTPEGAYGAYCEAAAKIQGEFAHPSVVA